MIARRLVSGAVAVALLLGSTPVSLAQTAPAAAVATPQEAPQSFGALYQPQDKDERGLWMRADEEERDLKNSNFVMHDPALNAYIHQVFCRTVGPDCNTLRLYIVRTPYFNATTAPNGMIQIWSGLFLRTRNEAQLAAVLAHEYVHYRDRHMIQLWRQLKAKSGSATFFAMFGLIGALIAIGQLASLFSFSREMEASADNGSVDLLVKAGYDPNAAYGFWEQIRAEADATAVARNTKSRKDKNGGMFATHPTSADRITALHDCITKAKLSATPGLGAAEYRAAMEPYWATFIDDQIKMNDFGGSEFLIGYLAKDGWTADLSYARGELYRARGLPADLTAAAGFYRQALTSPDAPPEAWRGLGLSLLRSGGTAEGQDALKHYLALVPNATDKPMIAMLAGSAQ
jgi:hypothetical protein